MTKVRSWTGAAWWVAAAVAVWSRGYMISGGNDLWWHLATGRRIASEAALPAGDPWSFTADGKPWILDAWLSDLILWGWSALFGIHGLVYWKWGIQIATFLVLMRLARRIGGSAALAFASVVFAAATAHPFLDMRPQMHSLLGLAVLLDLAIGRDRLPWALVPLFVLWSNLHSGFAIGVVLLPLLALPQIVQGEHRARSVGIVLMSLCACLINPNGYRALAQPLSYASDADSPFRTLSEWESPFGPRAIDAPLFPVALALCAGAALWTARGSRREPRPWAEWIAAFVTASMALTSQKFISYFALASVPLVVRGVAPAIRARLAWLDSLPSALVALALGIGLLVPWPQRPYAFHYLTSEYSLPIETLNFIDKNRISGKVFAYYQWGGYLDYRTDGRLQVYIDGRASALFDAQTFADYTRVARMQPGWLDLVNRSDAEFVLWPLSGSEHLVALVGSGVWRPLYSDSISSFLARAETEWRDPLLPTDESAHQQLALGWYAGQNQQHEQARRHFERALVLEPWEARACDLLTRSEVMLGQADAARASLRRCRRLFPAAWWEQGVRHALAERGRGPG